MWHVKMKRGRMIWCDKCGARIHTWQENHNGICNSCLREIENRLMDEIERRRKNDR